jgi:hypothetical protein
LGMLGNIRAPEGGVSRRTAIGSKCDCRKWGKSGRMDKKEARPSRGALSLA